MLYIMRHGKTDWNAEYRLQGRTDIPLNDEGRQMAKDAAIEYKDIHLDICYCSPLLRAQETAKLVLENRNIPIITDNRLIEMCFGKYEGQKDIFNHPEWSMYNFFKAPEKYIPEDNAESIEQLYSRTGDFLREVIKKDLSEGKDILIVGHGAMNNSIISQIQNIPVKDFWTIAIPNCKIIPLGDKIPF